mmetsp:Transcript_36106/g.56158  ORF Transcript_36106/g.56158 Transcript_36106/m.56158 type:complete len:95 (+) Transcript_36106:112-396(+)
MSSPRPAASSPTPMKIRRKIPGQPRKGPKTLSKPKTMLGLKGWPDMSFPAPGKATKNSANTVPMMTVTHVKKPTSMMPESNFETCLHRIGYLCA